MRRDPTIFGGSEMGKGGERHKSEWEGELSEFN